MQATSVPRAPRNASPSVRGVGYRGGIQKRRSGPPVRIDKDGDMEMDSSATRAKPGKGGIASLAAVGARGTGRGRGVSRVAGNAGAQRAQAAILRGMSMKQANIIESRLTTGTAGTMLKVDGLKLSKAASNPDGGLESLLAFLERKASGLDSKSNRIIKIKKSHMKGDSVFITATPEDIERLAKLNNFMFAGATLTIEPCDFELPPRGGREAPKKEESQEAQMLKERLKNVLSDRYNASLKLLNLSNLSQEPVLVELGKGVVNTSKIFPALMVVCNSLFKDGKEKRESIVSVTLANNNLDKISLVNDLATTLPSIKNLDLSGNLFPDLKSLQNWRWKFRNLENLVLSNNPLETTEPNYNIEIMKWYPKLLLLNGIPVRTAEQVAALISAANSPIPISGGDFRDVGQVGENFIKQFINLYDNNRAALLSTYYDDQSVFSMALNLTSPRNREHSTAIPAWTSYTKQSRNMLKVNHISARMNRSHSGIAQIQSAWSEFPATKHPDLATEFDKYMIECRPQPGLPDPTGQIPGGVDGLLITIHGEFEEQNSTTTDRALRSFSRTFVLGPGAPGGPQIRVISDMMTLRAHSPLATLSQQLQQPIAQSNTTSLPQEQQEMMARQLMEKTMMNMEYAGLCLQHAGWDLEAAFKIFEQNKATLPPAAFLFPQ